jgi:tellurite resistance protein
MTLPRPAHLSTLALLTASLVSLAHGIAQAAPGLPKAAAASSSSVISLGSAPQWHELTTAQKKVLMPLAQHWVAMDDASRAKWANVADRFDKLNPAEKQRVQDRMTQWARLPAQERGEARLRFQQTRQLSADQRQQKWAAYQALPPEARQDLAQQAKRAAKPVYLADGMPGPREAKQAYTSKRTVSSSDASAKKSNVAPSAATTAAPAQTIVRPTMVKAGAGATTSLVSQRPSPPPHQQTGMPKIAAGKGYVDPVTLLPKKGAQSAAMASLPTSATGEQHPSR